MSQSRAMVLVLWVPQSMPRKIMGETSLRPLGINPAAPPTYKELFGARRAL